MSRLANLLSRVVERGPSRPVDQAELRGWFFLATVKVGVMICVPLFALGGALGTHMRLAMLAPAVFVGALATTVLAIATGLVGMRARVPTAVLVRQTFGMQGAKVVAAILIVTLFGWFGVQTEVVVSSINALLDAQFGFTLPRLALTVACGALISSTAIIGVRALGKVSYVAVPLLLAVIAVPVWIALHRHAWVSLLDLPAASAPYSFGDVVSIIVGGHIVAIAITPDVSRFMRSARDTAVGIAVGYGVALPILLSLAALLALIYRNGDLVAIMILTGVGGPAIFVLLLSTWTANDKNLYETSLALATLAPKVARWKLTIVAAIAGTTLAAAGIFSHFIAFLVWMGITIGPVAGVYLVDYALAPGRYRDGDPVPSWRRGPFVAWMVGIVGGLVTLPAASGGLGLATITSAPTLDALFVGAVAHVVIEKTLAASAGRAPRAT